MAISRAALRRLAHDAQQRLTQQSYDLALRQLDVFLADVLAVSLRAARFARRRAISKEHVAYAASALQLPLPRELRDASPHDLRQLQRCNIRAPAAQRKRNALHAEISEAAFGRVIRKAAASCQQRLRISATARRFLQLIAEQHIMAVLAPAKPAERALEDMATAHSLAAATLRPLAEARGLAACLTDITNQIEPLLRLSGRRTVDARLMRAACGAHAADGDCSPQLRLLCTRILRGRVFNMRVNADAGAELGRALAHWQP
jgi:histone H3/H4